MATAGDIRVKVQDALNIDPMIDSNDIEVDFFGDDVMLNGTVPSQEQRAAATIAAQQVDGVSEVHNLLAVALPSAEYGDDHALAELANEALAANHAVPAGITVTAREGDLYLTGTVRTEDERAAAEDCVAGCAGVLSVTNEIAVLGDAPSR